MDNLWPIVTSLIFTPVSNEFSPTRPPFLTLSQNIGLLVGAVFWGFGCDIFGRRWAFNLTIGITAVFGLAAAGSPTFAAIGTFATLWSIGVGGNLPVDSASKQFCGTVGKTYTNIWAQFSWSSCQVLINIYSQYSLFIGRLLKSSPLSLLGPCWET